MDDLLTKLARRYLASWSLHYGLDCEDRKRDKLVEALRRALDKASKEGARQERRREEELHNLRGVPQ